MMTECEHIRKKDIDSNGREWHRWWKQSLKERKFDTAGAFWFLQWTSNPYKKYPFNKDSQWIGNFAFKLTDDHVFESIGKITQKDCWEIIKDDEV